MNDSELNLQRVAVYHENEESKAILESQTAGGYKGATDRNARIVRHKEFARLTRNALKELMWFRQKYPHPYESELDLE